MADLIVNTEDKTAIADIGYKTKLVVGGDYKTKFLPNANLSFERKTLDEFYLNVNAKDITVSDEKESLSSTSEIKVGDRTDRFYIDDDGNLEYEIELDKKPISNKVELEIKCSTTLEFFHQSELTEKEKETSIRPDDITNSYAIYCNKKDNKYLNGKVCHIKRSFVLDKNKKKIWCEQLISVKDGVGTWKITIPEEVYNNEKLYPLIVAPTLGATAAGGSTKTFEGPAYGFASHRTASASGTCTKIGGFFYSESGSDWDVKLALYDDDSGNGEPQAQLQAEASLSVPAGQRDTDGAIEVDYTAEFDAEKLWIAVVSSYNYVGWYYDSGDTNERCRETLATSNDLPAVWGTQTQSKHTDRLSLYVKYETGGGSPSILPIKFTLGQIEHKPNIVLHDFPYKTGSTLYSRFFWNCFTDTPSLTGETTTVTLNTDAVTSNDGLYIPVGSYASITCTDGNNIDFDEGCISFDFKDDNLSSDSYGAFFSDHSSNAQFSLYPYSLISHVKFAFYFAGTRVVFIYPSSPIKTTGEWNHIKIYFKKSDYAILWINGIKEIGQTWNNGNGGADEVLVSGTPTTTVLRIGSMPSSYEIGGTFKNFMITNDVIQDYGAYFTGNSGTTQLDDGMYHKDITYANSDGTSLDIGVTSYSTVTGNIDADEGSMSFWFDPDDYAADTDLFGAAATMMIEWDDSDDDILFTYGSVSIRTTSTLSGGDNHIKVTWEASGEITLEANGVAETAVTASTAPTLDASFTIDSSITDIFVTSSKGTPQIPCAGKIPLDMPIVRND